jgi:hypothetical protein
MTGATSRVVEQELPTLPEHLSSPLVFSVVRFTRSLVLCVVFCRSLFVLFLLVIVLFVLLQVTDSDYPLIYSNSSLINFRVLEMMQRSDLEEKEEEEAENTTLQVCYNNI